MPNQTIPTELLLALEDVGLPQRGEGHYITHTSSGVGQHTVYHPTREEMEDAVVAEVGKGGAELSFTHTQVDGSWHSLIFVYSKEEMPGARMRYEFSGSGPNTSTSFAAAVVAVMTTPS